MLNFAKMICLDGSTFSRNVPKYASNPVTGNSKWTYGDRTGFKMRLRPAFSIVNVEIS